MTDIKLTKINEAYIKINADRHFVKEMSEYFTFFVPGYQYMPDYINRIWDGKIRLVDSRKTAIYSGLIAYIEEFCKSRNYSLDVDDSISLKRNFSLKEAKEFIDTLNLPFEVRDYQLETFVNAIRNYKLLILSPTASGKSLIIYLIMRYIMHSGYKKGLLIVPTTSLVEQMFTDFESYGFESEKYCHRQYAGKDKNSDKFLTITTWQSIYKREPEYFEQFDFVFGDEAHTFKSQSLVKCMTQLINAEYRLGTTGTLDGTTTHKLVLEGLFGPVYQATTTKELMDNNHLAKFKIKCLILKYPKSVRESSKEWEYKDEIRYIVSSNARNAFIKNLALSLKGNTLILFTLIDLHGKILFNLINKEKGNRKVFFVFAKTEVEEREAIRAITEKENDAIIVASYGTFSTGINIKNLHNVIFAAPYKSRIKNLQSIGRVLRKGDDKEEATLFDIADDFRIGKRTNIILKHFMERIKIYDEQKFEYKFYNIEIKNE